MWVAERDHQFPILAAGPHLMIHPPLADHHLPALVMNPPLADHHLPALVLHKRFASHIFSFIYSP
jgi:hypothetical protein